MKEKLKDHFKRYANTNVAYVAGTTIFLTESAALSYGKGEVKKVTRSEVEQTDEPPFNGDSKGIQTLTIEQVEAMDYQALKEAVKVYHLTVENYAKETLYAALIAAVNKEE